MLKPGDKETIICSAIWFKDGLKHEHQPFNIEAGFVVCGHRHHNCFTTAHILQPTHDYIKICDVQGFITNTNRFVDRKEGWVIAYNAKQINDENSPPVGTLFSEDIY